jgi:hypothetical protein
LIRFNGTPHFRYNTIEMFPHIPSLITLFLAGAIIYGVYKIKVPLLIIAVIVVIALIITVNSNLSNFAMDYSIMASTGALVGAAPYIMIGAVIIFGLAYIMMLSKGSGKSSQNNSVPEIKNIKPAFNFKNLGSKKPENNPSASILEKIV